MKLLRSLLRITGATVVTLALLLSATYFGLRSYGQHRLDQAINTFKVRHGPLDPAAYQLDPVPNHRNGAVWWQQAAAKVYLVNRRSDAVSLGAVSTLQSWQPWMREQITLALEENAEAMPLFHYAAALPEMNFQLDYGNGHGASSAPIIGLLSGARLLAVTARIHFSDGRPSEALRCMHTIGRLATALENEVDVILQLAGWTVEGILLHLSAELAAEEGLSLPEVQHLLALIPELDLESNFHRYLSWSTASGLPIEVIDASEIQQSAPRVEAPGRSWWERRTAEMTRELYIALDLETQLRTVDDLNRPAADLLERPTRESTHGLANPTLFVARMQAVVTSRNVVRTALELRLGTAGGRDAAQRSPAPAAPFNGGHVQWQRCCSTHWQVTAPGCDGVAVSVFPNKLNPVPPFLVRVPAAVMDPSYESPCPSQV